MTYFQVSASGWQVGYKEKMPLSVLVIVPRTLTNTCLPHLYSHMKAHEAAVLYSWVVRSWAIDPFNRKMAH